MDELNGRVSDQSGTGGLLRTRWGRETEFGEKLHRRLAQSRCEEWRKSQDQTERDDKNLCYRVVPIEQFEPFMPARVHGSRTRIRTVMVALTTTKFLQHFYVLTSGEDGSKPI